MDVLQPQLIWVNDKCYRFFESGGWVNPSEMTTYIEDDDQPLCEENTPCDIDIEIVPFKGSKLKHTFQCHSAYFPFIIGAKGTMIKKLQTETGTTIQIPKTGTEITIIGGSKERIASARHRIDLLMASSKDKLRPTHFISIPMATDNIIAKFEEFKNDVLGDDESTARGIESVLFQKPFKFHITIITLLLLSDEEVQQAVKLLNDCKRDIIDPILHEHGPITIEIKGVDCFTNNPEKSNVLYGRVNTRNNILQTLGDKIAEYYADSGFLHGNKPNITLHMTLMNTTFKLKAENPSDNKKVAWKSKSSFDATNILKNHSETVFGEVTLKDIHLSCIETAIDSYYEAAGIITVHSDT